MPFFQLEEKSAVGRRVVLLQDKLEVHLKVLVERVKEEEEGRGEKKFNNKMKIDRCKEKHFKILKKYLRRD